MKHHIAARPRAPRALRSASVPDRAFIEMSSLISSPSNPMKLANHFAHHCAGSRGRRDGVDRAKHNMCGHPQGKFRERPECGEIA